MMTASTARAPKSPGRSKTKPASKSVRWKDALPSRDEMHERKKIAVVREAGRAFRDRGFHNTSLDDVAAALNLTKPALYYYIGGKRELLFETQSLALDMGDVALQYGLAGRNGLDRLQRTLEKYIELLTDQFASHLVLTDLEDMLPEHRQIIRARRRKFDTVFRELVSQGIDDGSILPCDPKMVVFWFMGAVNAIPRWYQEGGSHGPRDIASSYVRLISNGIAKRRAS